MNAAVQFIRNALCCIKDLEWYRDSVLYDAKYLRTVHGYDYPPYTEKTTPLEALISMVQMYVFITGVPSALSLLWYSIGKLQRIQRILERKNRQPVTTTTTNNDSGGGNGKMKLAVEKLLLQSLWIQYLFYFFGIFMVGGQFLAHYGNGGNFGWFTRTHSRLDGDGNMFITIIVLYDQRCE
jgi:hypothetical protein